jgi:hypothetical protein
MIPVLLMNSNLLVFKGLRTIDYTDIKSHLHTDFQANHRDLTYLDVRSNSLAEASLSGQTASRPVAGRGWGWLFLCAVLAVEFAPSTEYVAKF